MAVSCKQIAEMAGVSRQAAASVLNGAEKCPVSPGKKALILKLARELNYVRNNAAEARAVWSAYFPAASTSNAPDCL